MARNRSLAELNNKIVKRSAVLETTIADLIKVKSEMEVLEIGFGEGRVLLTLAWMFRDHPIRFYGIDKKQEPPTESREDLWKIAEMYDIFPAGSPFALPEIFFYDATNLQFPDEQFDFVYSAVVIRFIPDKARVLEEVSRVLRPGGVAILQIGESGWDYPYGPAEDDYMLTSYRTRFVLRHGQELIPLSTYLAMFDGHPLKIEFIGGKRCVLKLTKLDSGQLDLQLTLNKQLTVPMSEFPHGRGGIRSAYDLANTQYNQLFEQGLLSK